MTAPKSPLGKLKPSEIVRSWRDNIDRQLPPFIHATPRRRANDQPLEVIPSPTLIVNTKDGVPLFWREILNNIALACEEAEKNHGIK